MKMETKLIPIIQYKLLNMESKLVTSNEVILTIISNDAKKGEGRKRKSAMAAKSLRSKSL